MGRGGGARVLCDIGAIKEHYFHISTPIFPGMDGECVRVGGKRV